MDTSLRSLVVALACAGVAACGAFLPAAFLPPLALKAGILGVSAAACATDKACEQQAPARCSDTTGKGIAVTEQPDMAIPVDEANVIVFEPAYWQSEFVSQVGQKVERPGEESAGAVVVTDKSLLYVPPPGMEGLRVPLAAVVEVQTQMSSTTGAPRQVTVESCFGRLDRFVFGQKLQPRRLDSETTAAVAVELKARVGAWDAVVEKERKASR